MANETNEAVIRVLELEKIFYVGFWRKEVHALQGVNLEVRPNEILGFLGPNGAGKTTTIKALLGIIFPSSGSATVLGAPAGDVKTKRRIGFLPENPYFYDYLSGYEFLDFYSRFHGLSGASRKKRIRELLEKTGVADAAGLALRKYSKGMLQRIGMAQALLGDPDLVILDEPMSGLDPLGRRDMREMIFSLKDEGKTIFFSSHILPDVEQICDRVSIIHKGRIIDTGTLQEVLKQDVDVIDLQFTGLSEPGMRALSELQSSLPKLRVVTKGDITLVSAPGWEAADRAESIGRAQGGRLVSLQRQRETLENFFLREIEKESEPDQ